MAKSTNNRKSESYANTSAINGRCSFVVLKIPVVCFLCISILLLAGCVYLEREGRIYRHKEEFNSYPAEVQRWIKEGFVKKGFTETQVYLALGHPWSKTDTKWTYTACDYRTFMVPKSEDTYRSEFESAWKNFLKWKKKDKDAVFIPPDPWKEERRCRRYISKNLLFKDGILAEENWPEEKFWIDDDYHRGDKN